MFVFGTFLTITTALLGGAYAGFLLGCLLWTVYSTVAELLRLFPIEMRKRGYKQ